eukprot:gene7364-488_t
MSQRSLKGMFPSIRQPKNEKAGSANRKLKQQVRSQEQLPSQPQLLAGVPGQQASVPDQQAGGSGQQLSEFFQLISMQQEQQQQQQMGYGVEPGSGVSEQPAGWVGPEVPAKLLVQLMPVDSESRAFVSDGGHNTHVELNVNGALDGKPLGFSLAPMEGLRGGLSPAGGQVRHIYSQLQCSAPRVLLSYKVIHSPTPPPAHSLGPQLNPAAAVPAVQALDRGTTGGPHAGGSSGGPHEWGSTGGPGEGGATRGPSEGALTGATLKPIDALSMLSKESLEALDVLRQLRNQSDRPPSRVSSPLAPASLPLGADCKWGGRQLPPASLPVDPLDTPPAQDSLLGLPQAMDQAVQPMLATAGTQLWLQPPPSASAPESPGESPSLHIKSPPPPLQTSQQPLARAATCQTPALQTRQPPSARGVTCKTPALNSLFSRTPSQLEPTITPMCSNWMGGGDLNFNLGSCSLPPATDPALLRFLYSETNSATGISPNFLSPNVLSLLSDMDTFTLPKSLIGSRYGTPTFESSFGTRPSLDKNSPTTTSAAQRNSFLPPFLNNITRSRSHVANSATSSHQLQQLSEVSVASINASLAETCGSHGSTRKLHASWLPPPANLASKLASLAEEYKSPVLVRPGLQAGGSRGVASFGGVASCGGGPVGGFASFGAVAASMASGAPCMRQQKPETSMHDVAAGPSDHPDGVQPSAELSILLTCDVHDVRLPPSEVPSSTGSPDERHCVLQAETPWIDSCPAANPPHPIGVPAGVTLATCASGPAPHSSAPHRGAAVVAPYSGAATSGPAGVALAGCWAGLAPHSGAAAVVAPSSGTATSDAPARAGGMRSPTRAVRSMHTNKAMLQESPASAIPANPASARRSLAVGRLADDDSAPLENSVPLDNSALLVNSAPLNHSTSLDRSAPSANDCHAGATHPTGARRSLAVGRLADDDSAPLENSVPLDNSALLVNSAPLNYSTSLDRSAPSANDCYAGATHPTGARRSLAVGRLAGDNSAPLENSAPSANENHPGATHLTGARRSRALAGENSAPSVLTSSTHAALPGTFPAVTHPSPVTAAHPHLATATPAPAPTQPLQPKQLLNQHSLPNQHSPPNSTASLNHAAAVPASTQAGLVPAVTAHNSSSTFQGCHPLRAKRKAAIIAASWPASELPAPSPSPATSLRHMAQVLGSPPAPCNFAGANPRSPRPPPSPCYHIRAHARSPRPPSAPCYLVRASRPTLTRPQHGTWKLQAVSERWASLLCHQKQIQSGSKAPTSPSSTADKRPTTLSSFAIHRSASCHPADGNHPTGFYPAPNNLPTSCHPATYAGLPPSAQYLTPSANLGAAPPLGPPAAAQPLPQGFPPGAAPLGHMGGPALPSAHAHAQSELMKLLGNHMSPALLTSIFLTAAAKKTKANTPGAQTASNTTRGTNSNAYTNNCTNTYASTSPQPPGHAPTLFTGDMTSLAPSPAPPPSAAPSRRRGAKSDATMGALNNSSTPAPTCTQPLSAAPPSRRGRGAKGSAGGACAGDGSSFPAAPSGEAGAAEGGQGSTLVGVKRPSQQGSHQEEDVVRAQAKRHHPSSSLPHASIPSPLSLSPPPPHNHVTLSLCLHLTPSLTSSTIPHRPSATIRAAAHPTSPFPALQPTTEPPGLEHEHAPLDVHDHGHIPPALPAQLISLRGGRLRPDIPSFIIQPGKSKAKPKGRGDSYSQQAGGVGASYAQQPGGNQSIPCPPSHSAPRQQSMPMPQPMYSSTRTAPSQAGAGAYSIPSHEQAPAGPNIPRDSMPVQGCQPGTYLAPAVQAGGPSNGVHQASASATKSQDQSAPFPASFGQGPPQAPPSEAAPSSRGAAAPLSLSLDPLWDPHSLSLMQAPGQQGHTSMFDVLGGGSQLGHTLGPNSMFNVLEGGSQLGHTNMSNLFGGASHLGHSNLLGGADSWLCFDDTRDAFQPGHPSAPTLLGHGREEKEPGPPGRAGSGEAKPPVVESEPQAGTLDLMSLVRSRSLFQANSCQAGSNPSQLCNTIKPVPCLPMAAPPQMSASQGGRLGKAPQNGGGDIPGPAGGGAVSQGGGITPGEALQLVEGNNPPAAPAPVIASKGGSARPKRGAARGGGVVTATGAEEDTNGVIIPAGGGKRTRGGVGSAGVKKACTATGTAKGKSSAAKGIRVPAKKGPSNALVVAVDGGEGGQGGPGGGVGGGAGGSASHAQVGSRSTQSVPADCIPATISPGHGQPGSSGLVEASTPEPQPHNMYRSARRSLGRLSAVSTIPDMDTLVEDLMMDEDVFGVPPGSIAATAAASCMGGPPPVSRGALDEPGARPGPLSGPKSLHTIGLNGVEGERITGDLNSSLLFGGTGASLLGLSLDGCSMGSLLGAGNSWLGAAGLGRDRCRS